MHIKLFVVFVSSALFASTLTASINTVDKYAKSADRLSTDLEKDEKSSLTLIDDFDLDLLNEEQLEGLVEAEDEILKGQLDIFAFKSKLSKRPSSQRVKRVIPIIGRVAFGVGRALFRQFSRGRLSRSGSRLTQQYHRQGNYGNALQDFNRLNPSGVRNIGRGNFQGQTGRMGPHSVTVRNRSSGGSPTLEIRSPRGNGETMVRKFRYD